MQTTETRELTCELAEHEKQPSLNLQPKVTKESPIFEPCPSGPCVLVKSGSTCAPAFCGKQPPQQQEASKQLFKLDSATCEHPIAMRFQDSNCLVCEACGTVLETFTTDPVALVEEAA